MRTHPDDPRPTSRTRSRLAGLEEEVDTAFRPAHTAVTVREDALASQRTLQRPKNAVEANEISVPVHALPDLLTNSSGSQFRDGPSEQPPRRLPDSGTSSG